MEQQFQRICLVHYHEIGLKGHNRSRFEDCLRNNIRNLTSDFPIVTIHRIAGRLCIFLKEGTDAACVEDLAHLILNIPGVARVSFGYKCERDLDVIGSAATLALSEVPVFESFKVAARRNHTDFATPSIEINRIIGAVLCEAFPEKRVRMKDFDVQVGIEVIQNAAYVYAHSIRGIGGLPVGTGGNVVSLLSSGIDSPVATWRIARRGARCIGVHFSGAPQTSDNSSYLVDDIAHVLQASGCIDKVYYVQFGDIQKEIALQAPQSLRIILYRRLMIRVALGIARIEHAKALVTGESLGQVASQTLDNIAATDKVSTIPVLRPLIGTDKLEIIEQAQRLGTFDLSSQDAPDCCTLFMPRNPETHAKIDDLEQAEKDFPLDEWVSSLIDAARVENYRILPDQRS